MNRGPRAMNVLATVVRKTIEIVLPAYCVGCGAGRSYLCERCVAHAGAAGPVDINVSELTLDSAVAAFAHTGVARTAVHRLKYTGLRAIAPLMAAPMARVLRSDLAGYTLVPVPLHPKRFRERGFNQAALLASGVGALTAMTVNGGLLRGLLRRRTQLGHQADSANSRLDRRANVVGAFEADRDADGMDIVLVDDVVTTGSTMGSAARELLRAGARSVRGLAFSHER